MEVKNDIYLSLGSNIGDREGNVRYAISEIEKRIGTVLKIATFFENEAQGFKSDTLFLNTCIHLQSVLSPIPLLVELKKIEAEMGRKPKQTRAYESRIIDLDIILFNDLIFKNDTLTIPHQFFKSREFVLVPLNEIASDKIDPVTCLTIKQLLKLLKINICTQSKEI